MSTDLLAINLLRLAQLTDNIQQNMALLNEYGDLLLLEEDPMRRTKYLGQVERLRISALRYKEEYHELILKAAATPQDIAEVQSQLQEMYSKSDHVLARQNVQQNNLRDLRSSLLARLDGAEQAILGRVTKRLDYEQLSISQTILDAITTGHLSPQIIQETLIDIQYFLHEAQQGKEPLPRLSADDIDYLAKLIEGPQLSSEHKLKIIVPIIPFLLAYESEINLESSFHLNRAWQRLVHTV